VTDTAFIAAELINARHDPVLAHLREDHVRSYALALKPLAGLVRSTEMNLPAVILASTPEASRG
jgi:hypothetical protein